MTAGRARDTRRTPGILRTSGILRIPDTVRRTGDC